MENICLVKLWTQPRWWDMQTLGRETSNTVTCSKKHQEGEKICWYSQSSTKQSYTTPVLSVRAGGGGVAPVVGVWWAGCGARMKVDIKSFHPEVKASKSVKRFQRYSHFKPSQFHLKFNSFGGTMTPFRINARPPVDVPIAACYEFLRTTLPHISNCLKSYSEILTMRTRPPNLYKP